MTRKDFLKSSGLVLLGTSIPFRKILGDEVDDFDYRTIAKQLEIEKIEKGPGTLIATLKPNKWRISELPLCRNYDLWMNEAIGKNALELHWLSSAIERSSEEVSKIRKNTTYTFVHSPDSNEKFKFSKNQYNKIHKELVDRKLIKATDKIRIGFNNNFPLQYAQHKEFYNIVFTYGAVNYEIV